MIAYPEFHQNGLTSSGFLRITNVPAERREGMD
jgi:hypothetical protein